MNEDRAQELAADQLAGMTKSCRWRHPAKIPFLNQGLTPTTLLTSDLRFSFFLVHWIGDLWVGERWAVHLSVSRILGHLWVPKITCSERSQAKTIRFITFIPFYRIWWRGWNRWTSCCSNCSLQSCTHQNNSLQTAQRLHVVVFNNWRKLPTEVTPQVSMVVLTSF